jgi:hypothetical protein
MKRLCLIAVLGLFAACGLAQNTPESPELPKGSVLRVTISDPVEVRNSKVGDPVRVSVLGLVARGGLKRPKQPLTLVGHITDARPRTEDEPNSTLGIAFDKIVIGNLPGETRELPVGAVITRVVKEEWSVVDGSSRIPTSGDDPAQRAGGPMDGNGRLAYSHPPLDRPGPTGPRGAYDQPVKDFTLHADESTNVTVIVSKKRDVVLESGMRMIVRVNSSGK